MIIEGRLESTEYWNPVHKERKEVLYAVQSARDTTMSTSTEVTTFSTVFSEGWPGECRPEDGAAGSNGVGVSAPAVPLHAFSIACEPEYENWVE